MIAPLFRSIVFAIVLLAGGGAFAHPHVRALMKSEIIFASDGSVTGVHHAWTFDKDFSNYATRDLTPKNSDQFSREELATLAEVNATSLKEFDYFTFARVGTRRSDFTDPKDYYFEHNPKDGLLTLHFTLSLKTPLKAKEFLIDIFDQSYFVDFRFVEKDPVALNGAPAQCNATIVRPQDPTAAASGSQRLDRSFAANSEQFAGMGSQFASRIMIKCP